jgi:hypothetical protein
MNKTMAGITLAATLASLPAGAQAQDAREGPIEIDKCQTISQPGSYKLVNNLTATGSAGSVCLSITANSVMIDLAGFMIASGESVFLWAAIEAGNNTSGITVRNGSILGPFVAGVRLDGDGSTVEGLRVSGAMSVGIVATGIVRGNTAVGLSVPSGRAGGIGIDATGVITGNYVSGNEGVGIIAGQGSTVIGNTATKSSVDFGMEVLCPSNVTDNTITGNQVGNLSLQGKGCNNTNNVGALSQSLRRRRG